MLSTSVADMHTLRPLNPLLRAGFATFLALCCWQLWKARNAAVFRHEAVSVGQLLRTCKSVAELWRHRLPKKEKSCADNWCAVFDLTIG